MSVQNLSALSPQNYPFDLEFLPQPSYLVGGAVRDAMLGRRREYLDLDFIVPGDAVEVAKSIAKHYKAGFVLLDAEREIARVVFKGATVDFARQEGGSLEKDLLRRDFTVNAIAYNPHTQEIIDPAEGCADISRSLLRMISAANFEDDPLRLMRGYRQASQLGFVIDEATQSVIRSLAPIINRVAAERIRAEISYMLGACEGSKWIIAAWEDGLLTNFFKNSSRENIDRLGLLDGITSTLEETCQELGIQLRDSLSNSVKTTWLGIAKLTCLVNQIPEKAEAELLELSYSRAEAKSVAAVLRLIPQLEKAPLSLREQYFFFQEAGAVFPSIIVAAISMSQLHRRNANYNSQKNLETSLETSLETNLETNSQDEFINNITPLINRYLRADDKVAHPQPLVTGKDIMEALGIPASPMIGKLLTEIAVAQVEDRVSTVAEAIQLASTLINS
jgi:tRNA nucleotidyltransferase (CCA-adding enzyme)